MGKTVMDCLPADEDNFETRVLRESLPVVHLALAYAQLQETLQRDLRTQPKEVRDRHGVEPAGQPEGFIFQGMLGTLLTSAEVQEGLLTRAAALADLLPTMRKPRVRRVFTSAWPTSRSVPPPLLSFIRPSVAGPGSTASSGDHHLGARPSIGRAGGNDPACRAGRPSSARC